MAEAKRIIELLAEILDENRKTNKRLEHLKDEQKKTNVLLKAHTRDLLRIANLLEERVVHWGIELLSNQIRKLLVLSPKPLKIIFHSAFLTFH
jgi:uncharacterized protein YlxW (UPF0749 family)